MKNKNFITENWMYLALLLGFLQTPFWNHLGGIKTAKAAAPTVEAITPAFDLNIFAKLAKQSVPSVVNLSSVARVQTAYSPNGSEDLFNQFFAPYGFPPGMRRGGPAPERKELSLGTGFIIDESGIIMTNNHVVARTDDVDIQLTETAGEKAIQGKVIGRDPELDIALIQFKPPGKITALSLGNSDALDVGEFVMAVGNPYGRGHSVAHGIISAKGRMDPEMPVASYLQTDTPINPGNSGGPLLNLKGEVVGINNAIDARAQGISFAIPINYVKSVLPQLKSSGKVSRGFIGATIGLKDSESQVPVVMNVMPGGPAEKAGLKTNDEVTLAGTNAVHTPSELILAVTATPVGEKLPLTIVRQGKTLKVDVKVEARPLPEKLSQR